MVWPAPPNFQRPLSPPSPSTNCGLSLHVLVLAQVLCNTPLTHIHTYTHTRAHPCHSGHSLDDLELAQVPQLDSIRGGGRHVVAVLREGQAGHGRSVIRKRRHVLLLLHLPNTDHVLVRACARTRVQRTRHVRACAHAYVCSLWAWRHALGRVLDAARMCAWPTQERLARWGLALQAALCCTPKPQTDSSCNPCLLAVRRVHKPQLLPQDCHPTTPSSGCAHFCLHADALRALSDAPVPKIKPSG